MNGKLFDNLEALHEVCLKGNVCIDTDFDRTTNIEYFAKFFRRVYNGESTDQRNLYSLKSELDAKCKYKETDSKLFAIESCGVVSFYSGAVVNGNKTLRGQW